MSKETGWIYSITNNVNGKRYIGLTRDLKDRWYRHKRKLNKGIHKNEHLQNAFNKYGKSCFEFKVLESNIPQRLLCQKEKEYINKFNAFKEGYNRTTGGERDYSLSDSTKNKLSKIFKGQNSSANKISPKEGLEIFKKYHNSKLTYSDLAEEYSLCEFTISNIVTCKHWSTKHLNLEKPEITQAKKHSNLDMETGAKILKEYQEKDVKYKYLAKKYNTNPSTIGEIVRGEHWTTRHLVSKDKKSKEYHYIDKKLGEKIYKLYHNTEISQNQLAKKFNLSQASIWNIVNCKHKSTKKFNN